MITEFFKIAVRNIKYRGRRSWLTVVGTFIGIAAVVALVSLGQGLQDSVEQEFEQIGSDKVFINSAGSATTTSSNKLDSNDLNAVRGAQSVSEADGVIFATTTAEYNDEQEFVTVLGTPTGETQDLIQESWALEINEGREVQSTDTSNIVIGSAVAENRFGEEINLRNSITVNEEDFRVVGTYKATGDPSIDQAVVMPYSRAAELVDREEDTFDWVFARVQEGFTTEEAANEVERELRNERNLEEGEEDFSVSTQEDLLNSFNSILSVVRGVVIGIASISLLVGAVNIMNTMYTSVTQRTREIGVMKAIGASQKQITLLFLLESGIIGMIGGILGITAGATLSTAASIAATQTTNIQITPYLGPELLIGATLFSFTIGIISGILPARKAAKLPPAEALRYE